MSRYRGSHSKKAIMKIAAFSLVILFCAGSGYAADKEVGSGFHYDWWNSDEGDKGMQFYLPIRAASKYKGVSLELLGAYAYTQVDISGGLKRSLSDFTDTKLNFTYNLEGKYGCDILFGLGFNLPTGHTDLSTGELVLVVPPDLLSVNSFGEGLNVNPRISIARQWGDLTAGIGAGYTWRGEYDYCESVQDYDPGEIFTLTGGASYEISPLWLARVYGEYESFSKDTVAGDDYYQEGDVTLAGFEVRYARPEWELGFSQTGIFRDKSKIRQGTVVPMESMNSYGDEWISAVVYRYFKDKDTTVSTSLEYLYLDENGYDDDSQYYIGKRRKITLGCALSRSFSKDLKATGEIRGFIMDDEKNWYHPGEDYTYRGFSLGASVTKSF